MKCSSDKFYGSPKQASARFFALLALCALLPLGSSGCANDVGEDAAEVPAADTLRPTAVRSARVRTGPLRVEAHLLGSVGSASTLNIQARLPGILEHFPHQEGDWVEAGEVLARIDAPDTRARVERVRAEVRRAQVERDHVCRRQGDDLLLAEQSVLPGAALDMSTTNCEAATEAVAAARAAQREVESAQSWLVERAPIRGRVLSRLAEEGEMVAPGRPLLRLAAEGLEIRVAVGEADLVRGVGEGTRARVQAPGGDTFEAEVLWLSPEARRAARERELTLAIPQALEPGFWAGMSVDVWFVLDELEDATAVPVDALWTGADGAQAVFVVRGDRLEQKSVQPLLSSGGWVAVSPSLNATDAVVVGNLRSLQDGQRVLAVSEDGQP